MNIGKLSTSGAPTSDTCNSARKIRRILIDCVEEAARNLDLNYEENHIIEVDCYYHFRNVWLDGMTKSIIKLSQR